LDHGFARLKEFKRDAFPREVRREQNRGCVERLPGLR
jgi:hypothetical protein